MKIAILLWLFPPKWLAGTEIATYNLAKHLAKKGHEVHVITSLDEGLPKESLEQDFHVHRVRCPRVRFLGIIIFWLKAFPFLKRINPDVIHAQGISMGMPGFLAKKFLGKPYIVWGRGFGVYFPWLFKNQISKLVLGNANAVIALTEDMKGKMERICNRDVCVIPNGIDLEGFQDLPTKEVARESLGLDNNDRIVLLVANLRPVKGVRYLIEAINIVRSTETKVRLLLMGDGEERQNLEAVVKSLNLEDCVSFTGKVPNEKVSEYMAASDVFVLPSLSEGFPMVILEAMASGLPIVATKVGGLPEIIEDGENGFLVQPKNPQQIAERVLLFLNNSELAEQISKNNQQKAKEYSWENIAQRLEDIYYSCLSKPITSSTEG